MHAPSSLAAPVSAEYISLCSIASSVSWERCLPRSKRLSCAVFVFLWHYWPKSRKRLLVWAPHTPHHIQFWLSLVLAVRKTWPAASSQRFLFVSTAPLFGSPLCALSRVTWPFALPSTLRRSLADFPHMQALSFSIPPCSSVCHVLAVLILRSFVAHLFFLVLCIWFPAHCAQPFPKQLATHKVWRRDLRTIPFLAFWSWSHCWCRVQRFSAWGCAARLTCDTFAFWSSVLFVAFPYSALSVLPSATFTWWLDDYSCRHCQNLMNAVLLYLYFSQLISLEHVFLTRSARDGACSIISCTVHDVFHGLICFWWLRIVSILLRRCCSVGVCHLFSSKCVSIWQHVCHWFTAWYSFFFAGSGVIRLVSVYSECRFHFLTCGRSPPIQLWAGPLKSAPGTWHGLCFFVLDLLVFVLFLPRAFHNTIHIYHALRIIFVPAVSGFSASAFFIFISFILAGYLLPFIGVALLSMHCAFYVIMSICHDYRSPRNSWDFSVSSAYGTCPAYVDNSSKSFGGGFIRTLWLNVHVFRRFFRSRFMKIVCFANMSSPTFCPNSSSRLLMTFAIVRCWYTQGNICAYAARCQRLAIRKPGMVSLLSLPYLCYVARLVSIEFLQLLI